MPTNDDIWKVLAAGGLGFTLGVIINGVPFIPVKQAWNNCPSDCPFFRRDRGCIASKCIASQPQTAEPVKVKEKPKEEESINA